MVPAAVAALAAALGAGRRPAAKPGRGRGGFSHNWPRLDPFARSAYSYAGVGGSDAGTELAVPIEGTLFFAGEATESDGQNGTVPGAGRRRGHRVAKQVLARRNAGS